MNDFSLELQKAKDELKITQVQLCSLLFGVPHRTLQSWLNGEKEPPDYVIKLVKHRIEMVMLEHKNSK